MDSDTPRGEMDVEKMDRYEKILEQAAGGEMPEPRAERERNPVDHWTPAVLLERGAYLKKLAKQRLATLQAADPAVLYNAFLNNLPAPGFPISPTNSCMSHLMDGVVDLRVRAYDSGGMWMTNGYGFGQPVIVTNVWFSPPEWGEVGCMFYSNAVPATVEVQLGILEDRPMNRAASLGGDTAPAATPAQWSYLQGQVGHVQLFRQRVTIPSLDNSAYP